MQISAKNHRATSNQQNSAGVRASSAGSDPNDLVSDLTYPVN